MTGARTTVVVGNPKPQSRTLEVARRAAEELAGSHASHVIDLALDIEALIDRDADRLESLREQATSANLLVVGSPTYKGAISGLLKLFLDQLPGGALDGVVAVPVMLGGDRRHNLAPEFSLRPVLIELGATCPTPSLFVVDSAYGEPEVLRDWVTRARSCLRAVDASMLPR